MRFLLLACALAHSPQAASLGNVSGTFRGTWAARGGEPGHALKRWTPALNGTAFLTLATTPTRVDGVFDVTGELVLTAVVEAELDRIIGTLFATVEAHFDELVRLGFASRFLTAE